MGEGSTGLTNRGRVLSGRLLFQVQTEKHSSCWFEISVHFFMDSAVEFTDLFLHVEPTEHRSWRECKEAFRIN